MMNKWYNVNKDIRVWSGHSDGHHKQGWIYAPAAILAIEEYQGSVRFADWKVEGEGRVVIADSLDYPGFWVRLADISLEPYNPDEPVPDPIPVPDPDVVPMTNENLGAAVRLIVNFILGRYDPSL